MFRLCCFVGVGCVFVLCCCCFAYFCAVRLFGLLSDVLDCAGVGFVFVCCFVILVACVVFVFVFVVWL